MISDKKPKNLIGNASRTEALFLKNDAKVVIIWEISKYF